MFSRAKRSRKARENARKVVQSDDDNNDDDDDDDGGGGCLRSFVASFARSLVGYRPRPHSSRHVTTQRSAEESLTLLWVLCVCVSVRGAAMTTMQSGGWMMDAWPWP